MNPIYHVDQNLMDVGSANLSDRVFAEPNTIPPPDDQPKSIEPASISPAQYKPRKPPVPPVLAKSQSKTLETNKNIDFFQRIMFKLMLICFQFVTETKCFIFIFS